MPVYSGEVRSTSPDENDAGYSMQEMYSLSYNGLGNYYAGSAVATPRTQADADYVAQNPTVLDNGGHGAADDDNVVDLCRFIEAVQAYTGSTQIDLVGHSLGVTVARKLMLAYPQLAKDVVAFVGIAGANHRTTAVAVSTRRTTAATRSRPAPPGSTH